MDIIMMGNVRMKDIASALNISTVTVSKALSDKEGVSIELREKIKETAEAMGYRYNRLAKGMKEGKSYNIGVLIAERYTINDGDAFYLKIYQNIVKILSNRNYYGIMELVTAEDENNGTIPNVILDNKVDGIIVEALGRGNVPPGMVPGIQRAIQNMIPIVVTSRCPKGRVFDTYAYYGGGHHLKSLGVFFSGNLPSQKARILLMMALENITEYSQLSNYFEV